MGPFVEVEVLLLLPWFLLVGRCVVLAARIYRLTTGAPRHRCCCKEASEGDAAAGDAEAAGLILKLMYISLLPSMCRLGL